MITFFKSFNKTKMVSPITGTYFFMAFVEIIAELNKDQVLIIMTKPFLMPLLIALYFCASKKANPLLIIALLSAWTANLLLISDAINLVMLGALFYLIYRIFIMYIVFRNAKFPGYFPIIIGCVPFLILYIFVADITHEQMGGRTYLFILQGIFMITFGGFCLGTYILKANKSNACLLISTLLITAAQFILVIKIFYISLSFLKPLAVFLFVSGQFLLYHYILIEEKKRRRYRIIKEKE
jgi:uncharacterized membrane protein YhhN